MQERTGERTKQAQMHVAHEIQQNGPHVSSFVSVGIIAGTFSTSRTFLDDDPATRTASDTFTVAVTFDDGDGGSDTATPPVVTVNNVAPVVTATQSTVDVQYSDAVPSVTITATDVAADTLSATVTFADAGTMPGELILAATGCTVTGTTQSCGWTLSGVADVPPVIYTVTIRDDDLGATTAVTINVAAEDAEVAFGSGNPVAVQVTEDGGTSGEFTLASGTR